MMIRRMMHTPLNILAYVVLHVMFFVGGWFICRDAYNETMRLVGALLIAALYIAANVLFLKGFRVLDWIVFSEEGIERHSLFGGKLVLAYSEIYACGGIYTSTIEEKRCLIFAPKSLNKFVMKIDTSRFGNVIQVNRMGFCYCPMNERVFEHLKTLDDLEWIVPNNFS